MTLDLVLVHRKRRMVSRRVYALGRPVSTTESEEELRKSGLLAVLVFKRRFLTGEDFDSLSDSFRQDGTT